MRMSYRIALLSLFVLLCQQAQAVPPHPDAIAKWQASGVYEQKMRNLDAFKAAGGCSPNEAEWRAHDPARIKSLAAAGQAAVDTIWVPVILCQFPDYAYNQNVYAPSGTTLISSSVAATPASFDSLLFSKQGDPVSNPSGSMTDFYLENSYGKLVVKGDVLGWYTMPQPYTFYEGGNDGLGSTGPILARDAIIAADDAGVDFRKYANAQNRVPAVVVVHAGPGAETGAWGIWSHKSNVVSSPNIDGVAFSIYTMNPEEQGNNVSNMGVFAHEYGHALGLPDLYHTGNPPGQGIGNWSVMAGGTWNGNGARPAHFDAWCKSQPGTDWVDVIWLDTITNPGQPDGRNLHQVEIPAAETNPVVYALRNPNVSFSEYWMVENRQKTGFDNLIPGSGLLIYHIDMAVPAQNNSARYIVDVEEADGLDQLNSGTSSGDAGDAWPGSSNNRNFNNGSTPSSKTYSNAVSQIGVWNVSNNGPIMYADLDITFSRPDLKLIGDDSISFFDAPPGGDGDDILEPGETVRFDCGVRNFARIAYGTRVTLSCSDPSITFSNNPGRFSGTSLNPSFGTPYYLNSPILMTLPDDFQSAPINFTLLIEADSVSGALTYPYTTTINFTSVIGPPQVLLLDDDAGSTFNFQNRYATSLNNLRVPFDVWSKIDSGVPGVSTLNKYKSVIWFTGGEVNPHIGGDLTTEDAALMKAYLDAGGNLCLTSLTGIAQLGSHSSSFLTNYFKATVGSPTGSVLYRGVDGTDLGGGTRYQVQSGPITGQARPLTVQPGGTSFLYLSAGPTVDKGSCGIFSESSYKTVLLSVGIEFFADGPGGSSHFPKDTILARILEFFRKGTATDVQDDLENGMLPNSFTLTQNYPNPFNPTTTIAYSVGTDNGRPAHVTLAIYNLTGQRVASLVDEAKPVGSYQVVWDGKNSGGQTAATGVYFYRLTVGDRSESKKMILIK